MSAHWFEETMVGRRPVRSAVEMRPVYRTVTSLENHVLRANLAWCFQNLMLPGTHPALGRVPFVTQRFLGVR